MSEVLLQTIVEKLEALEIALLKENNASKDEAIQQALLKEVKSLQSEFTKLPSQFKVNNEKMKDLLESTSALNYRLDKPINEQIKHSHHLHKGIWVAVGLFIISLLLLYGWINCNNTRKVFEANDIKFRYLKVSSNTVLLKLLYQTDSLYNLNNDSFSKQVVEKEQHLVEQADLLRFAGEKKRELKVLKNKAAK